jgi:hypothetical protein
MKRKYFYILFLFCSSFFLVGCTIDYNLTINENLEYTEQVHGVQDLKSMKNDIMKGFVEDYYYLFSEKYKSSIINSIDNEDTKALIVGKKYKNTEEFKNSDIFEYFILKNELKENYDKIVIDLTVDDNFFEGDFFSVLPDELRVNITSPLKAIKHNANNYDKFTNTYTWYITSESDNKDIKIIFDKNSSIFTYKNIIIGVVALIILGVIIISVRNYKNNR